MKIEFEIDSKNYEEAKFNFHRACALYHVELIEVDARSSFVTAKPEHQKRFDEIYARFNIERAKLRYAIEAKSFSFFY